VAAFLLGVLTIAAIGRLQTSTTIALLSAGAVTAAIGFWDDHAPLSARWRLVAHFLAAAAALASLGGMPKIEVLGILSMSGWTAQVFGALMIVWLLNLYNFMDGIDGIAGVEAVTVCVGGAAVALVVGYPPGVLACLLLAAASAGFLVWNFPPAKIFMGDAGSGFLGVVFGVLAVDASGQTPALLWCWLILLGAFIVDATVTLLRRLLRGERVYQAHRNHAYQHAARAFGAHRPVTLAVGAINLLWLLPLALLVAAGWLRGEFALAIAWLPLFALAMRWRAGLTEDAQN
jgi:Fuc2NAc and GlcNAc transferase